LRQGRDGELLVADHAREHEADHQQRGRDRAADEQLRDVHRRTPAGSFEPAAGALDAGGFACPSGGFGATLLPGRSWYSPSAPACPPALSPFEMSATSPSTVSTCTGRIAAFWSGPMTYANVPCGPRWTTAAGTQSAALRVSSSTRALTNWFGHRVFCGFLKSALSRMVAVAWLIWLSMRATCPVPRTCSPSRLLASTFTVPPPIRFPTPST